MEIEGFSSEEEEEEEEEGMSCGRLTEKTTETGLSL